MVAAALGIRRSSIRLARLAAGLELCRDLEAGAAAAAAGPARLVTFRFGLILSGEGGFLGRIMTAFEYGLAIQLGSARRWVTWSHRDDAVDLVTKALGDRPQPLTNCEMTWNLARRLHALLRLVLPGSSVAALLGDFVREIFVASQRVVPRRATQLGFALRYPCFAAALAEIVEDKQAELPAKRLSRLPDRHSDHAAVP